jgi:hypothetical protein
MTKSGSRSNSKVPEILRLHRQGLGNGEIAAQVGCSRSNVAQAVTRYSSRFRGVTLEVSQMAMIWMREKADQSGITPAEFLNAVIVDAMADDDAAKLRVRGAGEVSGPPECQKTNSEVVEAEIEASRAS